MAYVKKGFKTNTYALLSPAMERMGMDWHQEISARVYGLFGYRYIGYFPMDISASNYSPETVLYALYMNKRGKRHYVMVSDKPSRYGREFQIWQVRRVMLDMWKLGGGFPEEFVPYKPAVTELLTKIALKELKVD